MVHLIQGRIAVIICMYLGGLPGFTQTFVFNGKSITVNISTT